MDQKKLKDFNNKQGQALIEFVLGLMIMISVFFFYVKMGAVFAIGNFIHYATFMSARALSSSANTPDQQIENAEKVLRSLVGGRWKSFIKPKGGSSTIPGAVVGPGPYFQESPAEDQWNQGVIFNYEANFSVYPWTQGEDSLKLELTSESWMRREEAASECNNKRGQIQSSTQATVRSAVLVEWDNGC
jgi:hypothetical protein